MKLNAGKPYKAFIRTGLAGERGAGPGDVMWDVPPGIVQTWRAGEHAGAMVTQALESDADTLVFADAFALPPQVHLRKALQLLARVDDLAAVTLAAPALEELLGERVANTTGNGVRQRIGRIAVAPPWFCVVRRAALEAVLGDDMPWQTLEYSLLAASAAWRMQEWALARLETQLLSFETRVWAEGVLSATATPLAEDYARYLASPAAQALPAPPQFRVGFRGAYTPLPEPMAAPEGGPHFSVLCPAFKPAFFEEMLKSVRAQTWPHWELLVRIDGPPAADAVSLERILTENADDTRIRWAVQDNAGTGITRARLAAEAQGTYLICIDDDDLLPPEALAILAGVAKAHPEAAILRGGTRLFGMVDQYLRPRPRLMVNGMSCDLFEVNQPFAIHADWYTQLGGFTGDADFGGAGEDTRFFLRADQAGAPAAIVDAPLYLRRISTHNQSLLYTGEQFKTHLRNLVQEHAPAGWRLAQAHFAESGAYVAQTLTLSNGSATRVHCPTAYFNYYTVGESTHTVIDLELTSLCNADCTFCPRDALSRSARFIEMDIVAQLAEELRTTGARRRVVLCGVGESTLHPQLTEIVAALASAGAEVCMTSNAVHLPIPLFQRLDRHGLAQLNVSVNAATAETHKAVMRTGKLSRVKQNVAAILEDVRTRRSAVEVNVSFVLHEGNRHELDDFVAAWRDSGVAQIFIHPLNNRAGLLDGKLAPVDPTPVAQAYAHDPRVIVDLFDFPRENESICPVAQGVDFVTVDGRMPLCVLDHTEQHVIGNLDHESLQRLHLNKIARYRRGEFDSFCAGCTFCPSRLRKHHPA